MADASVLSVQARTYPPLTRGTMNAPLATPLLPLALTHINSTALEYIEADHGTGEPFDFFQVSLTSDGFVHLSVMDSSSEEEASTYLKMDQVDDLISQLTKIRAHAA